MEETNQNKAILFVFLLAVTGILAYFLSFSGPWQFDDYRNIVLNEKVHDLRFAARNAFDHNRSLVNLSFAINWAMSHEPSVFHLTNVLIHLLNSVLVFWLLRKTLELVGEKFEQKTLLAFFGALIFLIHPIQTEAVAYVIQRLDLLMTFFYFLALVFYIKFRTLKKRNWIFLGAAVFSGLCSTYCKESAATIPLAILMFEFFFFSQGKIKNFTLNLKYAAPMFLLWLKILWYEVLRRLFLGNTAGFIIEEATTMTLQRAGEITRINYLLTQFNVLLVYIKLLFVPLGLHLDWDYPLTLSFWQWPTPFSFIILLGLVGVAVVLFGKARLVSFGIFWFFLTVSVTSSIFPIKDLIFEHRVYLSLVGFCFFSIWVFGRGWEFLRKKYKADGGRIFFAILGLYFLILFVLTLGRVWVWQDSVRLWRDNALKSPGKSRIWSNYGTFLTQRGDFAEAEKAIRRAIEIDSKTALYHGKLGYVLQKTGRLDEAKEAYRRQIELDSKETGGLISLGEILVEQGNLNEAKDYFEKALVIDSTKADIYVGLGVVEGRQNNYLKAKEYFEKTIVLDPKNADAHYNLSQVLKKLGDQVGAKKEMEIFEKLKLGEPLSEEL
jgi:Tfp pilus assembly protein PilF